MDRREFMTWMGVGGLAASLPVALAACNPDTADTTEPSTDSTAEAPEADSGDDSVIGAVADLETNGFILNEAAAVGPVLVVGTVGSLTAVNPTCPHSGCTVDWDADQSLMICPCHNSQFNADGSLKQGPAKEGLPTYDVEVDGDNIVVS